MQGRVKRQQGLQQVWEGTAGAAERDDPVCALCHRPLGSRVERHHRVPKSKGGTEMLPLHPICHRAIHAHVSNRELADEYADLDTLRGRADMQSFLKWIANKPADFNAPTRRPRDGNTRAGDWPHGTQRAFTL